MKLSAVKKTPENDMTDLLEAIKRRSQSLKIYFQVFLPKYSAAGKKILKAKAGSPQ